MLYLANPCGDAVVTAMQAGTLGFIDTPRQQNFRPAGVQWCADNGCFSDKWDADKWWAFLERHAHEAATCLFAVAPDVVGDAAATLERARPWLARIRQLGYPVAYVAQDGFDDHQPDPSEYDVLFIGGTTEWKLGGIARAAIREAKARGMWVHCGRVNSEKRWRYMDAIGVDSCDGTYLTFGPDVNLPKLLAWTRNNDQLHLFGGVA